MAAQDTPGTVEWFQAVAHRAGVWPDMHAPIGIWKAVQRYYDAMQLPFTRLESEQAQARAAAQAAEAKKAVWVRRADSSWHAKATPPKANDLVIRGWMQRHDIGTGHLGEMREAFEDAQTWHLTLSAAPNPPAAAQDDALRDMEARKDAAYLERNQVVAALAKAFPSGVARTAIEGWSEDWHGCVYIDLPTGQASWHFHDSQAYLFDGLPPYTGAWDGHSTEEKYRRLAALRPAARNAELSDEQMRRQVLALGNQIGLVDWWDDEEQFFTFAGGEVGSKELVAFARALLATASSADARDAARYRHARLCVGPDPDIDDLFNLRASAKHANESLALFFDDTIDAAIAAAQKGEQV